MRPSIDGPRQRVAHARAQLDGLLPELQRVTDNNHYYVVRGNYDAQTDRYELRVGEPISFDRRAPLQPILPEWSITISDIAHHLRSALDGLFWQLALLNGHTERTLLNASPKPAFPIYTRSKDHSDRYCEHEVGRYLKLLCIEHRAPIAGLQPYKRGNLNDRNLIALLSEINNADKHRLLPVVTAQTGAIGWSSRGHRFRIRDGSGRRIYHTRPLVPGTKLGWASQAFIDDVKVEESTAVGVVTFWEGCPAVKGRSVGGLLAEITQAVDQLVEGFAGAFA